MGASWRGGRRFNRSGLRLFLSPTDKTLEGTVRGPSIALEWSQAVWISPRWNLHTQLSNYMRFTIQSVGYDRYWLRFKEITRDYLRYNFVYFDSWVCRSHRGDIYTAWDHSEAMLGLQTAAHCAPNILTKPDQTHLYSVYWVSDSTPLVKSGIACKNTYILRRLSSCWFFIILYIFTPSA